MHAGGDGSTAQASDVQVQPPAQEEPSPTRFTSSQSQSSSNTPALDHIRETFGTMSGALVKFTFHKGFFSVSVDELYLKLQQQFNDVYSHLLKEMGEQQFILSLQEQVMREVTDRYGEAYTYVAVLMTEQLTPYHLLFTLFHRDYFETAVYHVLGVPDRASSVPQDAPSDGVASDQLNESDTTGYPQQSSPQLKGSESPNSSQVCLDFENGRCKRGSSCKYKHTTDNTTVRISNTPPAARVSTGMYSSQAPMVQSLPQPMRNASPPVPTLHHHHHHQVHHHHVVHHHQHHHHMSSHPTPNQMGQQMHQNQPSSMTMSMPNHTHHSPFTQQQQSYSPQPVPSPQPPMMPSFTPNNMQQPVSFPQQPQRPIVPHAVHHHHHHHHHHIPQQSSPGPNPFPPPVVQHHHHHHHHQVHQHQHQQHQQHPQQPQHPHHSVLPTPHMQMPMQPMSQQNFPPMHMQSPPSPTPPMALPQPRSQQGPPQPVVQHHVHHHHHLHMLHHHHHMPQNMHSLGQHPLNAPNGMTLPAPIGLEGDGPHRGSSQPQSTPPLVPPIVHHHVHHHHVHHHHHHAMAPPPAKAEEATEGDPALAAFIDHHALTVLKPLVAITTLHEIKGYSRRVFEYEMKQHVCSKKMREQLWVALHPDGVGPSTPRETPTSPPSNNDGQRHSNTVAQLKDFAANRSITFASFARSDDSTASPTTPSQVAAKPVQVPQPRSALTPSASTMVNVRAVLWLSGTQSIPPQAVHEAVSTVGTVVDSGYLQRDGIVDRNVMYFKFSTHNKNLQTLVSIPVGHDTLHRRDLRLYANTRTVELGLMPQPPEEDTMLSPPHAQRNRMSRENSGSTHNKQEVRSPAVRKHTQRRSEDETASGRQRTPSPPAPKIAEKAPNPNKAIKQPTDRAASHTTTASPAGAGAGGSPAAPQVRRRPQPTAATSATRPEWGTEVCKYYRTREGCRRGDDCKFVHSD